MNTKFLIIMAMLLISMNGCSKWLEDEKLTLQKQPYAGSELRTDGYYYHDGEKAIIVVILYEDGTMIRAGSIPVQEIQQREEMFQNGEFYEHIKNNKTCWCVYRIEDDNIMTNYWVPPRPYQCFFEEGTILNDTTFVIHKYYRIVNGEKAEETETNRTYHFRQFSPKPDSTNTFIP